MSELSPQEGIQLLQLVGKDAWFLYQHMLFLSSGGVCNVRHADLAKIVGISERTITRQIKLLSSIDVAGEPLVTVRRTQDGNIYKLATDVTCHECPNPNKDISLVSSKEELGTSQPSTPAKLQKSDTDVLFDYFRDAYENRYGETYRVSNYGREKGQVKNLIRKYNGDVDQLKAIIDVVMRLYDSKWKSARFTRPTIGALLSWLSAQAEPYALAANEDDEFKDAEIKPLDDDSLLAEYEKKGWI